MLSAGLARTHARQMCPRGRTHAHHGAPSSDLGMDVIAEAVEEGAQAQALRSLGCGEAQGYYFGRPAPAAVFAEKCLRAA